MEKTINRKNYIIIFNMATVILFIQNLNFALEFNKNPLSIIFCVLFLISFFITLWLNSYNKIFSIIKWILLSLAIIGFVLLVNDVDFPGWILVALSFPLAIPYFGMVPIGGKLMAASMSYDKASYICIGGFLIICVIISIVQEILKYKRKDDENEKVEDS